MLLGHCVLLRTCEGEGSEGRDSQGKGKMLQVQMGQTGMRKSEDTYLAAGVVGVVSVVGVQALKE